MERVSDDLRDQIELSMTAAKTLGNGYHMVTLEMPTSTKAGGKSRGNAQKAKTPRT